MTRSRFAATTTAFAFSTKSNFFVIITLYYALSGDLGGTTKRSITTGTASLATPNSARGPAFAS